MLSSASRAGTTPGPQPQLPHAFERAGHSCRPTARWCARRWGASGKARRRSPSPLSSWSGRCRARPTSAASSVQEGGLAAESQLTRRQILEMGASLTYLTSLVLPLPAQSKSSNVPMEALKDKDYGKSVFRQVVGRLVKKFTFSTTFEVPQLGPMCSHSIS